MNKTNTRSRVYLSGPITGTYDYKERFQKVAETLRRRGLSVYNPTEQTQEGHPWEWYMKKDIGALMTCNAICMLNGWRRSKGAKLERNIAIKLGYVIFYEDKL